MPLGLPSLHTEHWDPFWQACSDVGTIVNMHIGSSGQLAITALDAPVDVMITLQPMNIVQAAADLIFSPVFRKFPDVTVALSEGGIGWIPYFLERIDHTYKAHKAWTFADFGDKLPSQVFMEHVILCFIEDDFGARHAREIGTDRICIETDYPHSDAIWPDAPERLMQAWAPTDLTDHEINQMTHENAMRFFRFDPYSIRPARSAPSARCAPRRSATTCRSSQGPAGRAQRADDAGRVLADGVSSLPALRELTRPAQPRVLGRRRRQLPGGRTAKRSRRRRLAWGAYRVPESELRCSVDVRGRDVLELGCGAAQWSIALAPDAARASSALDVSHAQLAHARRGRTDARRSCRRAASSCPSPPRASTSCSATTAR